MTGVHLLQVAVSKAPFAREGRPGVHESTAGSGHHISQGRSSNLRSRPNRLRSGGRYRCMRLYERFADKNFYTSVATTFGVDFDSYEQIALSRLRGAGCRDNLVIVDPRAVDEEVQWALGSTIWQTHVQCLLAST